METTRTLVIVRHAKAEAFAPDDHARALTARGEADARALGTALAHQGVRPDVALVSDAARTRSTWSFLRDGARAAGVEWQADAEFSRAVYTADEDFLLQLVKEADPGARTLLVVGHNPTVGSLGLLLDDGEGRPDATAQMALGFPTAGGAVFTVRQEWADLSFGTARLTYYAVGHAAT
ncbi:SixA phosphatase family protein [Nocardioides alcanivorans]|uniref:SixA phosphatase family protein n=1 Tax=Nocardioides alcanivorans TaxID=2897352 RepID=UPI001F3C19FB|nr:histidine phosphatase family protein [Nocardioides alcanivorans]